MMIGFIIEKVVSHNWDIYPTLADKSGHVLYIIGHQPDDNLCPLLQLFSVLKS